MLDVSWFFADLQARQISFYSGVPDSLLKDFCLYVSNVAPPENHLLAANEGNAIALTAGYHLATGKIGLAYMQNSGLGNAVNPLTSLMDLAVYGIPALLLIGWRGEPGVHDEPQHNKQGAITPDLLDTLGIPYSILPTDKEFAKETLDIAEKVLREESRPYALVVQKGTFEKYAQRTAPTENEFPMSREEAIHEIASSLSQLDIVVSTTGMISRELFEYRASTNNLDLGQDFLTVGSMGHASQIALGVALQKPNRMIYCLDGDGAFIMHMGGIAIIGAQPVTNYKHIILNNGAHDSVGGQPTAALNINIPTIALSCGYTEAHQVASLPELSKALAWLRSVKGPALLEILVRRGARQDLGRPSATPQQNKQNFMKHCTE
jgi:phosphonopyruvate decarboxylase